MIINELEITKKERLIETLNKRNFSSKLECIEFLSDIGLSLDNSYDLLPKIKNVGNEIYIVSDNEITKYVKTWEHVCGLLNINIDKFNVCYKNLSKPELALKRLICIIKCLNQEWIPNFDDQNEYKYTPYFDLRTKPNNNSSFSYIFYSSWFYLSNVGAGLLFKNKELMLHCVEYFLTDYEQYFKYNFNTIKNDNIFND